MSSLTESRSVTLEPGGLLEQFNHRFPQPDHYWVGFSGGLDSTVLLHLLASLRGKLRAPVSAIHIDHALQPGSAEWAVHCHEACGRLGIELCSLVVDAVPGAGESPEAAARVARYRAIAETLGPRAMLLTAHHRDDQAETLLLQLLRGAGVEGLAAMPAIRDWNQGWHARPLLGYGRQAIRAWAEANHLRWLDDPSNAVGVADRNYLRHQIVPRLVSRWPGAVENIARAAGHCADAAEAMRRQAEKDLGVALDADRLPIPVIRELPLARARNVLRYWLRRRGAPTLSLRRLSDAYDQLCNARSDALVRIIWNGVEIRRFRDEIWLMGERRDGIQTRTVDWVGEEMRLGPGLGRVRRRSAAGGIDPERWDSGRVQIAYRDAVKRCRIAGRAGSRTFKKLAQEFGIPPWLREITPVLLIDGRPAAIANCCVCEPYAVTKAESGWVIEWLPD